ADYPLKVMALGEVASVLGYSEELRPPGRIPQGARSQSEPAWPQEPRYNNPYSHRPSRPAPPISAPQTYEPRAAAPPAPLSLLPRSLDQQARSLGRYEQ